SDLERAAIHSHGIKHTILVELQRRLQHLPRASSPPHPGGSIRPQAVEIFLAVLFTLATAAVWIFAPGCPLPFLSPPFPRKRRRVMRDTWQVIDLKLGAFVRGECLLVILVGTILSLLFYAIGLPYWLLIGAFAGVVEIVPVIGPLAAGALAIAVGLTESWQTA